MARKEKTYHYIYKTTCNVTKRFYIGLHSTDDLNDGYKGSGKRLWYSISKHGWDNHETEILEYLPDRKSLKKREKEIVNEELLDDKMCMNLALGGEGGFVSLDGCKLGGQKMNEKIWDDPEFRKRNSERKSKMFKQMHKDGKMKHDTFTGRTHSEESKKKMSETAKLKGRKGNKNPQFGKCWITNGKDNTLIYKGELIPTGWRLGRQISLK